MVTAFERRTALMLYAESTARVGGWKVDEPVCMVEVEGSSPRFSCDVLFRLNLHLFTV